MKVSNNIKLLGISLVFAMGLAACDTPGPAENAGKKLDQTANTAGQKIGDAVDKAGEKLSAENAKASVAIEDAEITAKVKAAIFAESGLKTLQISVDTIKGIVTLSGSVDSQSNRERAKALAGAVAGVREVNNLLVPKV